MGHRTLAAMGILSKAELIVTEDPHLNELKKQRQRQSLKVRCSIVQLYHTAGFDADSGAFSGKRPQLFCFVLILKFLKGNRKWQVAICCATRMPIVSWTNNLGNSVKAAY